MNHLISKIPALALAGGLAAGGAAVAAVPASASVTGPVRAAAPQAHRSCSINWRWRRVGGDGGNAQAWVDGMSPDGCGRVRVKLTCRNRLGGSTFYGTPWITAAQGGVSKGTCSSGRYVATIWVEVQKGSGTPVDHRVYG